MNDQVILVDEDDLPCGSMDKLQAHLKGVLHRAFSIFIINDDGQILLQKRALTKYHSGGLWSNTCCSHPRPGEDIEDAAQRRLKEEMGFDCALSKRFSFVYRASLNNHLDEHEFDHVFFGRYNDDPLPEPDEVAAFKWVDIDVVSADIKENDQSYTYWFSFIWERAKKDLQLYFSSHEFFIP